MRPARESKSGTTFVPRVNVALEVPAETVTEAGIEAAPLATQSIAAEVENSFSTQLSEDYWRRYENNLAE
jgi:hypothetical protein